MFADHYLVMQNISMAHLRELSDKLQRLDDEVRQTRVSKVLDKIRGYYEDHSGEDLSIIR